MIPVEVAVRAEQRRQEREREDPEERLERLALVHLDAAAAWRNGEPLAIAERQPGDPECLCGTCEARWMADLSRRWPES